MQGSGKLLAPLGYFEVQEDSKLEEI